MTTVSSHIITTGSAVTRAADNLYLPYSAKPQLLTLYVSFIETGTAIQGANANIATIGDASNTDRVQIYSSAAQDGYRIFALGVTGTVLASSPTLDDVVELMLTINNATTGQMTIYQSINSGTAISQTDTFGMLPATWNAERLYFNSVGSSNVGFIRLINCVCMRGIQTFATMRRIARSI
jgi:hypothetical protein